MKNLLLAAALLTAPVAAPAADPNLPARGYIVSNFHPASCGWLANWSVERNYCANSYLTHLDRVRDDTNYRFVLSECNNLIAIRNFQPARFAELQTAVQAGRVELVNGFFLEPTINLSGGEALAKMGIEGLRWQQSVMGVRPRYCWAIDVCGTHYQMPQLCEQLGLEALIYTRCNRAGKSVFWSESPDGSRVLTVVPGHYSENIGNVYTTKLPPTTNQLAQAAKLLLGKKATAPAGAPALVLGGSGDYALAPVRRENPAEFLAAWQNYAPACELRFTGLSPYVDDLWPRIKSGQLALPTVRTGTSFTFDSFWIENPRVKAWYRRDEHALQAAEMAACAASLTGGYTYPVNTLYDAWLQMLLNMDRNTLWGSAGGMVFESPVSWDVQDRFEWVAKASAATALAATRQLAGAGPAVALFNAANWSRTDPLRLRLPEHTSLAGAHCEAAPDGTTFCEFPLPATGLTGAKLKAANPAPPKVTALPKRIKTAYYTAVVDPVTGALTSLQTPAGREMLGGPANVLVAEKHTGHGDPGDFTNPRPGRPRLGSSSDFPATLTVTEGPLTITVAARSQFVGGGACARLTRFFKHNPRIEFETEVNDVPDRSEVVAEFPLAAEPNAIRRGIPFGFSRDDGTIGGIVPAVRYTDYILPGTGGLALLDRGVPGREINGRIPVIYLLNATEKYYGYTNAWLSGQGSHHFEYALLPHGEDWLAARVPQHAWEYNCPATLATDCAPVSPRSFVQTSDNVIVEALRRDGRDIELRLVEATGQAGLATVTLNLPHTAAAQTDLTGGRAQTLAPVTTGNAKNPDARTYQIPVRAQQIVTLRFATAAPVPDIQPRLDWTDLVPPQKLAALHQYIPSVVGHPPSGK